MNLRNEPLEKICKAISQETLPGTTYRRISIESVSDLFLVSPRQISNIIAQFDKERN